MKIQEERFRAQDFFSPLFHPVEDDARRRLSYMFETIESATETDLIADVDVGRDSEGAIAH